MVHTDQQLSVPAKYHHDHDRCHHQEKRCSTHHWADQQRKSILDLLWMFLCGEEVRTLSAVETLLWLQLNAPEFKTVKDFLESRIYAGQIVRLDWIEMNSGSVLVFKIWSNHFSSFFSDHLKPKSLFCAYGVQLTQLREVLLFITLVKSTVY